MTTLEKFARKAIASEIDAARTDLERAHVAISNQNIDNTSTVVEALRQARRRIHELIEALDGKAGA